MCSVKILSTIRFSSDFSYEIISDLGQQNRFACETAMRSREAYGEARSRVLPLSNSFQR